MEIIVYKKGNKNEEYAFKDLYGNEPENQTKVVFECDDENLSLKFRASFTGVLPEKYKKKTGKVYRADCVEVFIAFWEDLSSYYEFDVSPFNKMFASKIRNLNDEGIECIPCEKNLVETTSRVFDGYYEVNYRIPFKRFGITRTSCIYLNAYRVEMLNGKRISRSLNPTYNKSHHVRSSFVKLILEDEENENM